MSANFKALGNTVEWTNGTGGSVASGAVVAVGTGGLVGISANTLANGEVGTVHVRGVFEVACKSADVIAVGDVLDWDASASEFVKAIGTAASGDIENAVVAVSAAGNGVTLVNVDFGARLGTYTT
jgi:predicted RecA/RadA family phage recombinase